MPVLDLGLLILWIFLKVKYLFMQICPNNYRSSTFIYLFYFILFIFLYPWFPKGLRLYHGGGGVPATASIKLNHRKKERKGGE